MGPPLPVVALDHVGLAVPRASGDPLSRAMGAGDLPLVEMRSGVAIARFGPGDQLELVTPVRTGNPIERFLERRGSGLHHVAFQVDRPLASVLDGLRSTGIEAAGGIEPSSDGRASVFLHPSTTGGVLVELLEGPRPA